jgi:predicted DNA-binding transcriptional regulator YafY
MPIESIDHAVSQLIRMGTEVEVLDPIELRVRLATTARALVAMYDRAAPST